MEYNINREIISRTVEHYGEDYMTTVCCEEPAELIQAISKLKRGGEDKAHLAEEMADVLICVSILQKIYGVGKEEIQSWIDKKQQRQVQRMEAGE